MRTLVSRVLLALGALTLLVTAGAPAAPALAGGTACGGLNCLFLPTIRRGCVAVGGAYSQGLAIQYDLDNPVRPTATWVGKNLRFRGYVDVTGQTGYTPSLVDYGSGSEDGVAPQFRTIYHSPHTPSAASLRFYKVYDWDTSGPHPGVQTTLLSHRPITAIGLPTNAGEIIHAPDSPVRINSGVMAMVMYADANSVTIAYHRQDSAGDVGYTVYIDGLCTDPNLVALYNTLDTTGSRYTFVGRGSEHYHLPYLTPNQAIGTAAGTTVVVAIVDSGPFEDPRSCRGWWQESVGTAACPLRGQNGIN